MMEGFKYCSNKDCERGLLPVSEFKPMNRSRDGYGYYCNICRREAYRKTYQRLKEKVKSRKFTKASKSCTVCNQEFYAYSNSTKTCSKKCASIVSNLTKKSNLVYPPEYIDKQLWSKINRLDENSCWEWQGHRDSNGYGLLTLFGKKVLAHRMVLKLTNPDYDETLLACHRCDNPPCCNPNHVYPGTYKDNSDDKYRRGRANIRKGENNGRAKLTESQVIELRNLFNNGMTRGALSTKYSLTWSTVDKIVKREFWKEVA